MKKTVLFLALAIVCCCSSCDQKEDAALLVHNAANLGWRCAEAGMTREQMHALIDKELDRRGLPR